MFKSLFIISAILLLATAQPSCRFAKQYTKTQLYTNETARDQFLKDVLYWEGKFHQDGVGINYKSGLTYDGHPIDYQTGKISGDVHIFSASSKESIHVSILAKIVQGDSLAQILISNDSQTALNTAIELLTNKITSYEKFNAEYPGYGGFLPWFNVTDQGMDPTPGWYDQVPSLDNGQLLWSIVAVVEVLESKGFTDLATRYRNYLDIMTQYMAMIFYEGEGKIRAVAKIRDNKVTPTPGNYYTQSPCGDPCYLDDPYEGELSAFYLALFGGISQAEDNLIWQRKMAKLQAVDYTFDLGTITVQRGWWFSAHENWKYLLLPYQDNNIINTLFANGEKARTADATATHRNPGMFASINDVCPAGKPIPGYISPTGIQEIAFEKVLRRDVITGYATFPMFLVNKAAASVWLHNFLKAPKCQNPYGATEAININGTMISPLTTWDSKMTTVTAILGGVKDITRKVLQDRGVYGNFTDRLQSAWSQVFPDVKPTVLPFFIPIIDVPTNTLEDFDECKLDQTEVISM